ncbi:MAG: TVP38/TMEM64 family protein [Alphaproteobacteria bacterium]|nr:TVP38/TMEM64 family protein [Alphaproteobacteria bacterium]
MSKLAPSLNLVRLQRWLPLGALLALVAASYGFGLTNYLSLETLVRHQDALLAYVNAHLVLALFLYALVYVLVVSLSLPGAGVLSIMGGFMFGWMLSAPVTVIAATSGAIIVFCIVSTSLGASMAERAGPFAAKLSAGFQKDAFSYMLFLRLVPVFPFFIVNAVAGLARIDLRTYTLATLLGILPGSLAFAWLGRGLGSLIEAQTAAHTACVSQHGPGACPFSFSSTALITPQLLLAFAGLGVVALVPVALKKWRGL